MPCEVPGIAADMLTRDAIELIFREQEVCLEPKLAPAPREDGLRAESLDEDHEAPALSNGAARALTNRIRRSRSDQSLLILEAHRRRAWRALGYLSWERYVREEFGFSRSRSYELLNHGRVVRALMTALKTDVAPDISPFAAAQIRPQLPEVITELRDRIADGMPRREVRVTIAAVIGRYRTPSTPRRPPAPPHSAMRDVKQPMPAEPRDPGSRAPAGNLDGVIDFLLGLPNTVDLLDQMQDPGLHRLSQMREAAKRLDGLVDALERRHTPSESQRREMYGFPDTVPAIQLGGGRPRPSAAAQT
jgi:hypothetical protein